MREIQEKAIRIALQCYGNGCLSDEDFINLLKAIFDKDLIKFDLNPRLVDSKPTRIETYTTNTSTNTFENAK